MVHLLYTMYSVIVFTIYSVWYIYKFYTIQCKAYICCVHYIQCIHTYNVHWMYYLCVLGPVSLMGGVHYESRHVISCITTSNSVRTYVSAEGFADGCILRFFCGHAPNGAALGLLSLLSCCTRNCLRYMRVVGHSPDTLPAILYGTMGRMSQ